jgi:hypothetical protein
VIAQPYFQKMKDIRKIREEEKELILFLLNQSNLNSEKYAFGEFVFEYEEGKMGSIVLLCQGKMNRNQFMTAI